MPRRHGLESKTNPAHGIKKHNPDGTLNQDWLKANGRWALKQSNTRNPNIIQPSIRPKGTEGSEWDDYAWTADDL